MQSKLESIVKNIKTRRPICTTNEYTLYDLENATLKVEVCQDIFDLNFSLQKMNIPKDLTHSRIIQYKHFLFTKDSTDVYKLYAIFGLVQSPLPDVIKRRRLASNYYKQQEILNIFLAITEILLHLHENGIAHGNLKSSSVLFDRSDDVYITDIANNLAFEKYILSKRKPVDDIYIAPELLNNKKPDINEVKKGDVWSLGMLLIEMAELAFLNKDDFTDNGLKTRLSNIGARYGDYMLIMLNEMMNTDTSKRWTMKEVKDFMLDTYLPCTGKPYKRVMEAVDSPPKVFDKAPLVTPIKVKRNNSRGGTLSQSMYASTNVGSPAPEHRDYSAQSPSTNPGKLLQKPDSDVILNASEIFHMTKPQPLPPLEMPAKKIRRPNIKRFFMSEKKGSSIDRSDSDGEELQKTTTSKVLKAEVMGIEKPLLQGAYYDNNTPNDYIMNKMNNIITKQRTRPRIEPIADPKNLKLEEVLQLEQQIRKQLEEIEKVDSMDQSRLSTPAFNYPHSVKENRPRGNMYEKPRDIERNRDIMQTSYQADKKNPMYDSKTYSFRKYTPEPRFSNKIDSIQYQESSGNNSITNEQNMYDIRPLPKSIKETVHESTIEQAKNPEYRELIDKISGLTSAIEKMVQSNKEQSIDSRQSRRLNDSRTEASPAPRRDRPSLDIKTSLDHQTEPVFVDPESKVPLKRKKPNDIFVSPDQDMMSTNQSSSPKKENTYQVLSLIKQIEGTLNNSSKSSPKNAAPVNNILNTSYDPTDRRSKSIPNKTHTSMEVRTITSRSSNQNWTTGKRDRLVEPSFMVHESPHEETIAEPRYNNILTSTEQVKIGSPTNKEQIIASDMRKNFMLGIQLDDGLSTWTENKKQLSMKWGKIDSTLWLNCILSWKLVAEVIEFKDELPNEIFEPLQAVLSNMKQLKSVSFDMKFARISPKVGLNFKSLMSKVTWIKNFELCNCKIEENEAFYNIIEGLSYLTMLEGLTLAFQNSKMDEFLLAKFSRSINWMTKLQKISLNFIYAKKLGNLSWLKDCLDLPSLVYINLNFDFAQMEKEDSSSCLRQALSNKPLLNEFVLSLNHCEIVNAHLPLLGLNSCGNLDKLSLNLSGNDFPEIGFNELYGCLKKNCRSLTQINLSFAESSTINSKTVEAIKNGLSLCTQVQKLSLNFLKCYRIKDQAVHYIGQTIYTLTSIKELKLVFHSCQGLTDMSIDSLCRSMSLLQLNKFILFLGRTLVTDLTVKSIGKALSEQKNLNEVQVHLDECKNITDRAMEYFIESLGQVNERFELLISIDKVLSLTDMFLINLSRSIQYLKNLKMITIQGRQCKFSIEAISMLRDAQNENTAVSLLF